MRERFERAGRRVWALLFPLFRYLWTLIRKPGEWLFLAGRWLWRPVSFLVVPIWRLAGRVGLAQRNLFHWLVWEPFLYVIGPARAAMLRLWRLLGGMGVVLRNLLARFVWQPSFLLAAWVYRNILRPILRWLWNRSSASVRARWMAGAPKRALYRRRGNSRWLLFRANLRLILKRPKPPETAIIAPRQPSSPFTGNRSMRIATAFISVSIVLTVSLISAQDRQPDQVAAGNNLSPVILIATPSPAPATPLPSPTPVEIPLTPWPTPDPLSGGGTLVFDYRQNGNNDIYLLPIGQSEQIRLTSHPAEDREPAWSPNGQQIAFSSRRDGNWEIYVYDFSRGELNRITDDPSFEGNPGWSPDGQWLIYHSYQNNNLDIYIIKADKSEGPYRLTENPALDYAPVWSPGGRHIAFTSWRNGNRDIFILSLDDVSDVMARNVSNSPETHEDDPVFSPDGRYLAYVKSEAGLDLIYASPLADDYTVAGLPISLGQQGRHPTWAPNGQSLVYTHNESEKAFLVASSPDAWGVAPQAFAADGLLGNPSWSAVHLSPELANELANDPGSIDSGITLQPLYVEAIATSEGGDSPVLLWELPVSAPSPYLSDQVDQSFLALQARIREDAGWDLLGRLDGMFESLDSKALPGEPGRSWNKAGRAFDLYYREALAFEPRVEVVRQELRDGTYWRLFVRTVEQDGSQGEPLRDLPWDFQARYGNEPRFYDQGGKLKEAIPAGYYIDFTTLANDYGWTRVPSAENWRTYFPAIRFWHYENRQGLTWEQAMLQLYTVEELNSVP